MTLTTQNFRHLLGVLVNLCVSNAENAGGKKTGNNNQSQPNWKLGRKDILNKKMSTEFKNAQGHVVPCSATVTTKTTQV